MASGLYRQAKCQDNKSHHCSARQELSDADMEPCPVDGVTSEFVKMLLARIADEEEPTNVHQAVCADRESAVSTFDQAEVVCTVSSIYTPCMWCEAKRSTVLCSLVPLTLEGTLKNLVACVHECACSGLCACACFTWAMASAGERGEDAHRPLGVRVRERGDPRPTDHHPCRCAACVER